MRTACVSSIMAALVIAGLSACSAPPSDRLELSPVDFADESAGITLGPARGEALSAGRTPPPAPPVAFADDTIVATESRLPIVARPGRPEAEAETDEQTLATATSPVPPAAAASAEVLIEAKVGDINGRPVFVDSFLEPLSGRLLAEAQERPLNAWRAFAAELISSRLQRLVEDELYRAEALSRLSPEQKQGLRSFISGLREELISANYGSASLAEAALLEERGLTPSEHLAQQEATLLIRETISQDVRNRVRVSWRDIRQRYERDIDEYRPPPQATYRVIRARGTGVEKVAERLESGTPFAQVARSSLNNFNTDVGGRMTVELSREQGPPPIFEVDEINQLGVGLGPGEWAGPVEYGSFSYWVMLESITDEGIDLYDVQLEIEDELIRARSSAEFQRLYDRLTDGAIERSLNELAIKLLFAAEERYGPSS